MTIYKHYVIQDEDTIKVLYLIQVKLDIGDENTELSDVLDYLINSEEDLNAIPELEEEAKKREEVLTEKAMKLKKLVSKLESMGYTVTEEEVVID